MKIFIIGGVTTKSDSPKFNSEMELLRTSMRSLGAELVAHGHEIVVCSPFPDSADYHVLKGVAECEGAADALISIHYPEISSVDAALKELLSGAKQLNVKRFPCPGSGESSSAESFQYAWLFAQLNAMDSSAGVITVGGKPSGSLNLLFHLADAKNKSVLPLTFLGGAAQDHFDVKYWDLQDVIPDDIAKLRDPASIIEVPSILEALLSGRPTDEERSFFISYARARPNEADYVETLLRRRNHTVYRDEEHFEPSSDTQTEIIKNIKRANVFVALWCKEYACSPWCFDELEMALERKEKGLAELWIFCVDETRIVPRAARDLNYYPATSRESLEGKILFLLNKLEQDIDPVQQ
ncbi:MAG: toll/interleukin-1 receptor domain-containing protein [Verrucomicrobiales bacterium]|nr:toll/interleukin-1 receptor domain-containing protein [Verrucomicrobiales bacterium]